MADIRLNYTAEEINKLLAKVDSAEFGVDTNDGCLYVSNNEN